MSKIKVGFEVTDTWVRGDFKQFIQGLVKDERFDVYIISNDNLSSYIVSIGNLLGIPSNKVLIVNFTNDKIQAIINNGIEIYFENLQYVSTQIDELTDCNSILVTGIPNKYYTSPDYLIKFNRAYDNIINKLNEESGSCQEG